MVICDSCEGCIKKGKCEKQTEYELNTSAIASLDLENTLIHIQCLCADYPSATNSNGACDYC